MNDFPSLLRALVAAEVEFIVIGGAAAIAHGSAMLTLDLDVVYRKTRENVERLVEALRPLRHYPRGAPPGLPFRWDFQTAGNGLNFTLATESGPIDLLGEIAGARDYDELLAESDGIEVYAVECRFLKLEKLIEVKRAAGRPKDYLSLGELEAILEERQAQP